MSQGKEEVVEEDMAAKKKCSTVRLLFSLYCPAALSAGLELNSRRYRFYKSSSKELPCPMDSD